MGLRRDNGGSRPSKRGQTAVLGLVLLIGMVAAISVGILLVAGDTISDAEQRSANERIEQSFVELSQHMATLAESGDAPRLMTFDAGEKGAIVKTDTAYINISGDNLNESFQVGAIEYEGDDGTRIAYQAGGVFRETGEATQVVSEPPLEYNQSSHTFSFPIMTLEEDTNLRSGDVRFNRTNSTSYEDSIYVEQSAIQINITSEYCVGWETYFEAETSRVDGKAIQESCSEGDEGTLRVELGRMDIEEGTFENGIVAGEVSGNTNDIEVSETGGESPAALDPMIDRMVADMKDNDSVTNLSDVSGDTVTSGTYYTDSYTVNDDLTFDLTDGNATLVVEDELVVQGADFHVENWEQPGANRSLQIYVKNGTHVDGGNTEMCVDPCNSDIDSEHLQIYGKSDTHFAIGTGKAYFEGIMYAPSGGDSWNETNMYIAEEAQLVVQSNVDIDGSLVTSSLHVQSNSPSASYDASLDEFSPEIAPEGYVFPPNLSYLNIAEHAVEVKNV